ncbi:hypothetical protein PG993_010782 [Apiospora rasikravindrae]|uniref:Uncharacterized protein n=1 Tax=Apiospora rasikravindrae TaxID=990691 RepID=A0ABR1SCN2_9PEZI
MSPIPHGLPAMLGPRGSNHLVVLRLADKRAASFGSLHHGLETPYPVEKALTPISGKLFSVVKISGRKNNHAISPGYGFTTSTVVHKPEDIALRPSVNLTDGRLSRHVGPYKIESKAIFVRAWGHDTSDDLSDPLVLLVRQLLFARRNSTKAKALTSVTSDTRRPGEAASYALACITMTDDTLLAIQNAVGVDGPGSGPAVWFVPTRTVENILVYVLNV